MASRLPKNLPWIVIGTILALLAIGLLFVTNKAPKPEGSQPTASEQSKNTISDPPVSETASPGSYVVYSQIALDQANTSNRRVLFFHAGWCPQCRMLEEDINKSGVPTGMTIFKVNYDSSSDLKQKYGVTLQTTFVEIDSQGNLLKKHVAYSEPTLAATLKALGN